MLASHASTSLSWWDGITRVGVILSILLAARSLGAFSRLRYTVHGARSPLADLVGFHSPAAFTMTFNNRGSVPISFYDFEIGEPRLGANTLDPDGKFVLTQGAEWFVDGRFQGRLPATQAFSKINLDTRRVTVEPRSSRTEIFDLSVFELEAGYPKDKRRWPDGFDPVLQFEDSFGRRYVADAAGTRAGEYAYPHQTELDVAFRVGRPAGVRVERWTLLPWWWRDQTVDYPNP